MSARNRQRPNHNQDADEERRLWKEIRDKAKEVDSMVARSNAIGLQILDVESQQADLLSASKPSSATLDEQLEKLYRENLRLCEDVQHIIEGSDNDMNLLDSIKILAGLREASEESLTARAASKPGRGAKKAEGEESAAPSPRVNLGQSNRLNVKEKSSRASSIPATREASVKIEDGVESVASSADGTSKSSDRPTNKMTLKMGEIVFYRNKGRAVEGEGILCKVTNVIGEGKQRRYEIQDVDTDPQPGTGEVPPPWRASVSNLMQIPESNRGLGDLAKGKAVLAQYPDTTTFYKAEVSTTWKAKDMGGERGELVRLRFEGETENTVEQEVERRFVLVER